MSDDDATSGCRTRALTAAPQALAGHAPGPGRYWIAYGSHASGSNRPHSDLDLLHVTPSQPTPELASRLREVVIRLHHDQRLDLDTEVSFEVKLIATHVDIQAALFHAPFPWPPAPGQPLASAVPPDDAFLNSTEFKQRLLLNALTSPNVFLEGDLTSFTRHRDDGECSLALLAMRIMADRLQLARPSRFTLGEALQAVTCGPDGTTGQDFLGYLPSPALLATLSRGLHRLIAPRIAEVDRAAVWRYGPGWSGPATRLPGLG